MAVVASFGTNNPYIVGQIVANEHTLSTDNNNSRVNVYIQLRRTNSYAGNTQDSFSGGVLTVDGQTFAMTGNHIVYPGGAWCTVQTRENILITHDSNGNKTISISVWASGGQTAFNFSASGTLALTNTGLWNDINAYYPDRSTQKALSFDLATSDGGRWYDITNEPDTFNKAKNTIATISDIKPVVEGLHYAGNNIGEDNSWAITTEGWTAELYSAYNTKALAYYANGGALQSNSSYYLREDGCIYLTSSSTWHFQTATYGTNMDLYNITTFKLIRTGYHFNGWDNNGVLYNETTEYNPTNFIGWDGTTVQNTHNGGNAAFYASWGVNTAQIVYYTNGGTVSASGYSQSGDQIKKDGTQFFHNATYNVETNPVNASTFGLTKSGYIFKGWTTTVDGKFYDENTNHLGQYYTCTTGANLNTQNGGYIDLVAVWDVACYIKDNGVWKPAETLLKDSESWKSVTPYLL